MSRPLVALAAIVAVGVAIPPSNPFALIALAPLYLIAREQGTRIAVAAVVAVGVAYLVHDAVWLGDVELAAFVASLALCVAAVGFGRSAGARRTAQVRERELLAEQAVGEERLRIARELHDAVGHDVSLMVVQAQALGAVSDDARVRQGTDAIAALGRRTMGEMHRTLKLLRDDAERTPQPSLERLGEVLDDARGAGVDVRYAVEGAPRRLTPALDATAFRIVQEAVTNVVRHAGGAPATVVVRYREDELELVVADEGANRGGTANTRVRHSRGDDASTGGGHGLVGMRERAEAFGGHLDAAAHHGRGFQVRAVLPYEAAP